MPRRPDQRRGDIGGPAAGRADVGENRAERAALKQLIEVKGGAH